MEFLTILGTTALMASSLKTHWTDTITSPPKFGPLAQNSFWYCPNFVWHFLFYLLRIEILELTVTKHLWTYWHLNIRNKFSFMNVLVQLLNSLRQGFLTLLLLFSIPPCMPDSHPYRVINTKCCTDTVISPNDGHIVARNM